MRQVMAVANTLPLELRVANLERQVVTLTAEIHAMRQALDLLVAAMTIDARSSVPA